jgi:two-component system, LytTR family, response regulator
MTIMRTIRALIVDDEKPARERVRRLLARDDRVELAGCCAAGGQALDLISERGAAGAPIHLLFLDVQMPELDGFGVLASLVRGAPALPMPEVVFVTAHDEYALRAFDAHAIDYLLKPFSDERFQAALDRALRHIRGGHADAMIAQMQELLAGSGPRSAGAPPALATAPRPVDRIVVRGSNRVRLLPVDQISWIEADGMYVKLHTRDGAAHLHRALLGSLDGLLDGRRFVRIHRSAIVNIDVIAELRQDAHGDYVAVLRDQTEIRVGRRFRIRLQTRLGQQI